MNEWTNGLTANSQKEVSVTTISNLHTSQNTYIFLHQNFQLLQKLAQIAVGFEIGKVIVNPVQNNRHNLNTQSRESTLNRNIKG